MLGVFLFEKKFQISLRLLKRRSLNRVLGIHKCEITVFVLTSRHPWQTKMFQPIESLTLTKWVTAMFRSWQNICLKRPETSRKGYKPFLRIGSVLWMLKIRIDKRKKSSQNGCRILLQILVPMRKTQRFLY